MRHLVSLVLGVILAPLIYILFGLADGVFFEGTTLTGVKLVSALVGALLALAAGGLFSLLVLGRLSPVGTVVAGLMYLGVSLWVLVDDLSFVRLMPKSVFGLEHVFWSMAGTPTLFAAVPLLLTVFSPRRWRSSAQPAAPGYETPAYGTTTAAPVYQPAGTSYSATPSYGTTPSYTTPSYTTPSYGTTPSYTPPTYTPSSYSSPADTTISTPKVDNGF